MKKDILFKWITAMRSGKYPMAKGNLRSSNGYCPLGVLCDISEQDKWVVHPSDKDRIIYSYAGQINYLPNEVADWADLKGSERGDMPAIVMAMFDQGVSTEGIIEHLKRAYKVEKY